MLETPTLDAALARLGADGVVVGHTPTVDRRVRAVHGGKTIMLDTGLRGDYYAGRPAALIIEDGSAPTVQYLMPVERRVPEIAPLVGGYALTEDALRDALEHGSVVRRRPDTGADRERVELSYAGTALQASFYPATAAATAELAAAALDDLLGTDLVPPTVPRTLDGRDGAMQLRPADAITETERVAHGVG
jgi:hypothetical protein